MSFKQLVVLFLSLGPHKHRELSSIAGSDPDTVARWFYGTDRPARQKEVHVRHYLLSKLQDLTQLKADAESANHETEQALAIVDRVSATWDSYIEELGSTEAAASTVEKKNNAIAVMRRQLNLPRQPL